LLTDAGYREGRRPYLNGRVLSRAGGRRHRAKYKIHERADRVAGKGWQDCRDQPLVGALRAVRSISDDFFVERAQDRPPLEIIREPDRERRAAWLVTGGTTGVGAAVVEMMRIQGKVHQTARSVPDSAAMRRYIARPESPTAAGARRSKGSLDASAGIRQSLSMLLGGDVWLTLRRAAASPSLTMRNGEKR